MDNLIEKAKKLLHEANSGSYECKYYNDGFIDGVKYAEQQLKNCNLQNVNVRFPSKEKVIEEGERQIDVWLEGNTERELQHFRVGFRRSFEYVLRCLNAR